jgi:diaminopimelate epimerase
MMIDFVKMQGAGNDFIIIKDDKSTPGEYSALAKKICHRRFGVGADGLIVVQKSDITDVKWHFVNSDGSIGEMCGNGIRCFSNYVYDRGIVDQKAFGVETLDGIKNISIGDGSVNQRLIRVEMGQYDKLAKNIPAISKRAVIENESLIIDAKEYIISSIRMGVPHTVLVVNKLDAVDVKLIGPQIEKASMFPENTNVNFIEIIDKNTLLIDTWERGAGNTMACGTGACSAVIIANTLGKVDKSVTVKARGGDLTIELVKNNVYMTGRAKFICSGSLLE